MNHVTLEKELLWNELLPLPLLTMHSGVHLIDSKWCCYLCVEVLLQVRVHLAQMQNKNG